MTIRATDFDYIRALVRADSSIVLESGKEYLVESRLLPLARDVGDRTVAGLVRHLRRTSSGRLRHRVIEAMTINETSFFRDTGLFDALEHEVLPALIRCRYPGRELDVWCAAASSGQEPYSVAMLLDEALAGEQSWRARVLASDLSQPMLDRARAGTYSRLEVDRGVSPVRLARHFHGDGTCWQVRDELRRMVECRPINLDAPWPALPAMDLILLRNVLIYFDIETRRRVLARVRPLLRPDGFLVLGASETTINVDEGFERVRVGGASLYRLR